MEWTIDPHRYAGAEFFIVAMAVDEGGKHKILVEYQERHCRWAVRDACDSGESESLLKAFLLYMGNSRRNNTGGQGHCVWMVECGLPTLENELGKIIEHITAMYSADPSMN